MDYLMQEPSFRQNAERLAAAFSRYGGAARAAELLEELSIRWENLK
jgi:UDP:flavonoid glycosyltransferase YjiC (YdhE family)